MIRVFSLSSVALWIKFSNSRVSLKIIIFPLQTCVFLWIKFDSLKRLCSKISCLCFLYYVGLHVYCLTPLCVTRYLRSLELEHDYFFLWPIYGTQGITGLMQIRSKISNLVKAFSPVRVENRNPHFASDGRVLNPQTTTADFSWFLELNTVPTLETFISSILNSQEYQWGKYGCLCL